MALIQTVHLSMASFKSAPVVPAVQNDTDRQVKMIIDDFQLTAGLTGKIAFQRSDGTHYETAATLNTSDNSFTADIDQALTQPGRTMVQLKVTDTLTVSTFSFVIFVEQDNSGTVTPQEGIDLVSAVQAAEDAADRAESAAETLELDATLTQSGKAADAAAVGNAIANITIDVDDTLTQEGEAADAKATGDAIGILSDEFDGIAIVVESPNLLNFDDDDFVTGKYVNPSTGNLSTNSNYNTSGFIPVEAGKTYTYTYSNPVGTGRQMRFIAAFNSEKTVVSASGAESVNSYTVPSGVAFIRISCDSLYFYANQGSVMLYEGTSINQYYDWHSSYFIKNTAIDSDYINEIIDIDDTLSVTGKPADAKETGDQISDLRSDLSEIESVEYKISPNLINFNDENFETRKYMVQNGTKYNSGSYNLSGYIPVEEGKTYTYTYGTPVGTGRQMRFIAAFNSEKTVVSASGAESVNSYTVPSGVAFIRISCDSDHFKSTQSNLMLYEGTSIDQYYEYFDPYYEYKVKNDALDSDYINGLINAKFVNTLTDYGLVIKATADTLTSADTLTVVQRIDNKKNAVIEFLGYFDSFVSISLGHGFNVGYGNYAVIDNTHLTVYYGSTPTQVSQVSHGLTISDFIHVVITQNNGARAKIQITTASGDYTLSDCSWDGCNGNIFVKVGASMTDCVCNAIFKDFNEKVFLFGDSYVSMGDPARYPYYLMQNGYTHLLIDGYGGRNSSNALTSFNNVIANAIPKYAIWALGMNDGDTSSAVNASWLSCVQTFLTVCETNSIIPILATIPNCPSIINTFKNEWVKASGQRYIDFAKAVGAEEQGSSWYTGMLYTDNVHPTALGAKALYTRILTDVPEIIK